MAETKLIKSITDIAELAVEGFQDWNKYGDVYTKQKGDLLLFNYTNEAQYARRWNFFERVSRGLIIDKVSGEVIARPFDKFYNWGENDRKSDAPITSIIEKLDGSLGILYHHGSYRIATRGSFDGEQAQWATKYLHDNYKDALVALSWHISATLLFEIIYPENRIVVDYKGAEGLYLIGVRNRFTGEYLSYNGLIEFNKRFNFAVPRRYDFKDVDSIKQKLSMLDHNVEGWVVEFEDGQRFKFKGKEYLRVHKIIHQISFKNTLEAHQYGKVEELLSLIPDEFIEEVNKYILLIERTIKIVQMMVNAAFIEAPKDTRKKFALWAAKNYKPFMVYLFAKLDGKDILPLIYKFGFKELLNNASK